MLSWQQPKQGPWVFYASAYEPIYFDMSDDDDSVEDIHDLKSLAKAIKKQHVYVKSAQVSMSATEPHATTEIEFQTVGPLAPLPDYGSFGSQFDAYGFTEQQKDKIYTLVVQGLVQIDPHKPIFEQLVEQNIIVPMTDQIAPAFDPTNPPALDATVEILTFQNVSSEKLSLGAGVVLAPQQVLKFHKPLKPSLQLTVQGHLSTGMLVECAGGQAYKPAPKVEPAKFTYKNVTDQWLKIDGIAVKPGGVVTSMHSAPDPKSDIWVGLAHGHLEDVTDDASRQILPEPPKIQKRFFQNVTPHVLTVGSALMLGAGATLEISNLDLTAPVWSVIDAYEMGGALVEGDGPVDDQNTFACVDVSPPQVLKTVVVEVKNVSGASIAIGTIALAVGHSFHNTLDTLGATLKEVEELIAKGVVEMHAIPHEVADSVSIAHLVGSGVFIGPIASAVEIKTMNHDLADLLSVEEFHDKDVKSGTHEPVIANPLAKDEDFYLDADVPVLTNFGGELVEITVGKPTPFLEKVKFAKKKGISVHYLPVPPSDAFLNLPKVEGADWSIASSAPKVELAKPKQAVTKKTVKKSKSIHLSELVGAVSMPKNTLNFEEHPTAYHRTFIIGDVHGCLHELQDLLARIGYVHGSDRLIFVGDLLDRGPNPMGVFRLVFGLGAEVVLGNHEEKYLRYWKHALHLAGAGGAAPYMNKLEHVVTYKQLTTEDMMHIVTFPTSIHAGTFDGEDFTVVHAGFEPGRHKDFQRDDKIIRVRWVDPEGMYAGGTPGKQPPGSVRWTKMWKGPHHVIYGHAVRDLMMPTVEGEMVKTIGIDTGAVFGGHLTAFELPARRFHMVRAHKMYEKPVLCNSDA